MLRPQARAAGGLGQLTRRQSREHLMARASAVNRSARARRLTGGGVACTRLPRAVSRPGPAGVGMGMHLGTCRDRTPGASPGGGALDVQTHSRACQRPCAEDSHVKICERENPHANLHPLRTARAHSRRPSQPTTRAPCPGPLTRGSPPHRPPPAYLVPCGRGCGQQWRWWSVLGWRTKPDLPHELTQEGRGWLRREERRERVGRGTARAACVCGRACAAACAMRVAACVMRPPRSAAASGRARCAPPPALRPLPSAADALVRAAAHARPLPRVGRVLVQASKGKVSGAMQRLVGPRKTALPVLHRLGQHAAGRRCVKVDVQDGATARYCPARRRCGVRMREHAILP